MLTNQIIRWMIYVRKEGQIPWLIVDARDGLVKLPRRKGFSGRRAISVFPRYPLLRTAYLSGRKGRTDDECHSTKRVKGGI